MKTGESHSKQAESGVVKATSLSVDFVQRVSTPEFLARVNWLGDNDPRFNITNNLKFEESRFLTWCHAVGIGLDYELSTCIPPIPPYALREITGYPQIPFYLYHGLCHAQRFADLFDHHHRSELERPFRTLEFGAGAGRTGRYMGSHPEVIFRGTDINPRAVEWCNRHLPGLGYETSSQDALGYSSADQLDLIYSYSVFTHLPVDAATVWLSRLTERLKSEGLLIITAQSEQVLETLETSQAHRDLYQITREEAAEWRKLYEHDGWFYAPYKPTVIEWAGIPTKSYGNAFFSTGFLKTLLPIGMELVESQLGVESWQDFHAIVKVK